MASTIILFIASLALILALATYWEANRRRKATGIPGGRIVYSDTSRWQEPEKPLFDPQLSLTGRPDYISQDGKLIIPVEVKSSHPPQAPYDTHVYQLAAYCLLIHRVFGVRPPYGVLHYSNEAQGSRTFTIDFTPQLEKDVIRVLSQMRRQQEGEPVNRSHQSKARCKACGYRSICDQRLV